jgi:nitroimidazol reductase NimA-like FMN-containing flavoprotein (pyridoxamine 5'-phosphate oxidase superfamily)
MTNPSSWDSVLQLLKNQPLGVLGTNHQKHPYTSLVAFAATEDARCLYFATTRATRKYNNLVEDQQVAFLVDNRSNQKMILYEAVAVSIYGQAVEVQAAAREEALALYLAKHPQLKTFVLSPSTALFRISVESCHLVQRFQNVTEFRMDRCTS